MAHFVHPSVVGSSSAAASAKSRKDSVWRGDCVAATSNTLAQKALLWPLQPTPFCSRRTGLSVPKLHANLDNNSGGGSSKNATSSSVNTVLDPLAGLRHDDAIPEAFAYPGSQPPPQQELPQELYEGMVLVLLPPTNQKECQSRKKSATMNGKQRNKSGARLDTARSSKSDRSNAGT